MLGIIVLGRVRTGSYSQTNSSSIVGVLSIVQVLVTYDLGEFCIMPLKVCHRGQKVHLTRGR